jgi:hypothetical protein
MIRLLPEADPRFRNSARNMIGGDAFLGTAKLIGRMVGEPESKQSSGRLPKLVLKKLFDI